ncbi:MAG: hypothetical protein O7J95_01470 [Planctomycetota bacterium]|nr:hypothetical protein [Planctomycetota bacterium]
MVWCPEDFYREVRRQLVELESVRKKLRSGAEPGSSLEKLEESSLYLLRKLEEYFHAQSKDEKIGAEIVPMVQLVIHGLFQKADFSKAASKAEFSEGENVEVLAAHIAETFKGGLAVPIPEIPGPSKPPALDQACAGCGKSLGWSLISGDGLVQDEGNWFHKGCRDVTADGFSPPYSLN